MGVEVEGEVGVEVQARGRPTWAVRQQGLTRPLPGCPQGMALLGEGEAG